MLNIASRFRAGRSIAGLALATALACGTGSVRADGTSYATSRRQIKAGVLVSNAMVLSGPAVNGVTPTVPMNLAPYVFYVLDGISNLKPAGWEFVNPNAPSTITASIFDTWQHRNAYTNSGKDPAFTGSGNQFTIGSPVTKNIGAYWEVNLDSATPQTLQQYDILFLGLSGDLTSITPSEREKLRHYIDGGGTVWIECKTTKGIVRPNNNSTLAGGQLVVPVNFVTSGVGVPVLTTTYNPLITYPFTLSPIDIQQLGTPATNGASWSTQVDPGGTPVSPNIMSPIVTLGFGGGPLVTAGAFGAGHLVITSNDVAADINGLIGGWNDGQGPNTSAVSGDTLTNVPVTDLKFAYNMISWLTTVPTAGVNSRRTGSTSEVIGATLEQKWASVPPQNLPGGSANPGPGSGVVVDQGIAYYIDGGNVLHAYDLNPQRSILGSANNDDGIVDFALGTPYDEIWRVALKANRRYSTPTVYTVNDTKKGVLTTLVSVTDSTGTTTAYYALPVSGGALQTTTTAAWSNQFGGDLSTSLVASYLSGATLPIPAPSPAFSEGVLFTLAYDTHSPDANRVWRVAPVDPLTGVDVFGTSETSGTNGGIAPTALWTNDVAGMGPVMGPLAVGYVQDNASGAMDKIVYVPCQNQTNTTPPTPDQVVGLWFSTRGEPLVQVDNNSGSHTTFQSSIVERRPVPWFAPSSNNGAQGITLPRLHIIRASGKVDDLFYIPGGASDFTVTYTNPSGGSGGGGALSTLREMWITVTNDAFKPIADTDTVVADYTVDWPAAGIGTAGTMPVAAELNYVFNNRSASVFTPQNNTSAPVPHVIGAPALSPVDTLVFNANEFLPSGQTYTAGSQEMSSKIYGVQDQFATNASSNNNNPNAQTYGVISWMWQPYDVQLGGLSQPYRLINKDSFLPNGQNQGTTTPIVAFQAVGSPAIANGTVYIVGRAYYGTGANPAVVAVVLALPLQPSTTFVLPPAIMSQIVAQPGTAVNLNIQQFDPSNPQITTPSLTLARGSYIFDVNTGTVTITNFHTSSGDFNMALPVYVSGTNLVGTDPTPLYNTAGYGILDPLQWFMVIPQSVKDANTGIVLSTFGLPTSGPGVIGNTLYYGAADGSVVSIDLPTSAGGGQQAIYNGQNIRVHSTPVLTTPTGAVLAQNIIHPPVGTESTLVIATPQGIAALDNEQTVIADGNRLIMVGADGNATLTIDGTRSNTVAGGLLGSNGVVATTKTPLIHPSVAHRSSVGDFLIADTGNNRVAQIDMGGVVEWELHTLNNSLLFLRPGDPVTLNQPTDIQTWVQSGTGLTLLNRDNNVTYTYNGAYTAYHYLVADSGNFRAIEVMDVYAPNGQVVVMTPSDGSANVTMYHQVTFVTRTLAEQNPKLSYRTVQEFFDPNTATAGLQQYVIAAVDNLTPGAVDPGAQAIGLNGAGVTASGGSLLVFQRDFSTNNASQNVDGNLKYVVTTIAIPNTPGNVNSGIKGHQAISNPTWFKEFQVPATNPVNGQLSGSAARYLLADDNGVYVLAPTQVTEQGQTVTEAVVEWELSANDYYYMTGRRLQAASVVRLTQADYDTTTNKFYPHYLIANSFRGQDNIPDLFVPNQTPTQQVQERGTVGGEVFEVRSLDYIRGGYQNPADQLYFWDTTGATAVLRSNWRWVYSTSNPMAPPTLNVPPIVWMAPQDPALVSIGNQITLPATRSIGQAAGTVAGPLQQPTFADRPF